MKKLILCLSLVLSASAAELVLSTETKSGGVTTTVTVGRIQADPAPDGTITLQAIPREVVKLADGTTLSDKFNGEWITVKLSDATVAAINKEIAAAKAAADAAKAASVTPPAQ